MITNQDLKLNHYINLTKPYRLTQPNLFFEPVAGVALQAPRERRSRAALKPDSRYILPAYLAPVCRNQNSGKRSTTLPPTVMRSTSAASARRAQCAGRSEVPAGDRLRSRSATISAAVARARRSIKNLAADRDQRLSAAGRCDCHRRGAQQRLSVSLTRFLVGARIYRAPISPTGAAAPPPQPQKFGSMTTRPSYGADGVSSRPSDPQRATTETGGAVGTPRWRCQLARSAAAHRCSAARQTRPDFRTIDRQRRRTCWRAFPNAEQRRSVIARRHEANYCGFR